jgi:site-specific DNA recombinase
VTTAAIYVRISEDREGRELGIERQQSDCRELAGRRGWQVAGLYPDDDIGASTRSRKARPQYERLLTDARAGTLDVVVAYTSSRLTRRPRELEDLIDLAERHGTRFEYVRSPSFDLNTAAGRRVARILAATDAGEAEDISERLVRQREQAARAGAFHGSPRPFGYTSDPDTPGRWVIVNEAEAEAVRECAARVLAAESLASVCRDLNGRGVRTARGNQWTRRALRDMLASARISGRREHRPVADYRGGRRPPLGEITSTDADWPAIISAEDSDRLRDLLTRPDRVQGPRARSYLLSGILRCHACGSGLVGRPAQGTPRYVCDKRPGTAACGTISVTAAFADEVVRDMALVALEGGGLRDRLHARAGVDPAVRQAVAADERRLVELAEEWADPGSRMTRGEWRVAREKIEARLEQNRRTLRRATDTAPLDGMTGSYEELLALWEAKNVSQRRAVVAAVLDRVIVGPARRRYDLDRFDPVWRA